jgi:sulfite reductase (NADPH) flavoprotein alpha-component
MREAGSELWDWLRRGAYFYVCGDARRMARDVEAALRDIVAVHGGMGEDAATAHLAELKAASRYQADVY